MANLKGTTRIELTDVNTGEVEVFENHNMVTNALKDIFTPLGLSQRPSRYFVDFVPYYEKLLGGILCFDKEIPENPDDYYPPADANLIGCAAYGVQNNTTNTFTVTNGKGISSIALKSTNVLVDTYTITFNDSSTQDYTVTNGRGIVNITKTGRVEIEKINLNII